MVGTWTFAYLNPDLPLVPSLELLSPDEAPVLWDLVVPGLFPWTISTFVPKSGFFFIPFRQI